MYGCTGFGWITLAISERDVGSINLREDPPQDCAFSSKEEQYIMLLTNQWGEGVGSMSLHTCHGMLTRIDTVTDCP